MTKTDISNAYRVLLHVTSDDRQHYVAAIRAVRDITGANLPQCKLLVDSMRAARKLPAKSKAAWPPTTHGGQSPSQRQTARARSRTAL